jgi:GrpB-like predicted nucleotidyltransferase (UPF0157 family)
MWMYNRLMANHRPYSLVDYDPDWVNRFNFHAEKIKDTLGPVVLEIHHIGSTSIPGMSAKSNIDIEVVVSNLNEVRRLASKMAVAGYTARGDYSKIGEEYFTEDAKDGERRTSIHILPVGHPDIQMQINFRDYLRTHEEDQKLYMETKKSLYAQHRNDYGSYDSGKKEVIKDIKKRAKLWAKNR